jgi:hypothetical protein
MSGGVQYTFLDWITLEAGTWADWFSGTMSALAVSVALAGYWFASSQNRRAEKQTRQNAAYQIGFKLSALASETRGVTGDLNPQKMSEGELALQNPMETCGTLAPKVGFNDTMARDLNETEQNLLMLLKEENFLMDFSEIFARNNSIRAGLLEYKVRHEAIAAMLPTPVQVAGEVISLDLTQEQLLKIQPNLIAAASLVNSVRFLAKINVEMLTNLTDKFHPMMTKHFPDLHIHKIVMQDIESDGTSVQPVQ